MNRSQSWRKFPSDERDDFGEDKRANSSSQPNLSMSLGSPQRSSKSNVDELRRKIVRLNKELEEERLYIKQIKREKSIELKHAKEEEQRRAVNQQTELRTKLYKEKANELATLKEHIVKDKEKEILQIIKQKDETLKAAQLAWQKEKDELRVKIRAELWNDAREESKKEFDRERAKLEQDILDLQMQKKEIEETLKTVQESDKRKADEIRRLFHEHDMDMGKFKRNSWQESRRQMAEIRQLLNIIEQLERKLGLDSGHINKLRMEKESLYDELRRKTNTFDAWDSMMSTDSDGATDTKYSNPSHELRTLQRKNVELSSLVKKLDEKNQQLATRNTELLSELEQCEKEARDKNRKLEKKNLELTQSTKKLETKNKALLDELNSLKRKAGPAVTGSKDSRKAVRPRGQGTDSAEVTTLKEQIKDHAKTIEELKQNLMEKERRIDLLKERKRTGKKPKIGRSTADSGLQPDKDETSSVVSDISDLSEVSSDSNSDANKLKKLSKELLALERAYAILQAQVGSTVDVERDELERQQLQSDLIESQARIHELERMMDSDLQGGTEELQDLQHDNQVLYQKLVSAEKERDQALNELSNNTEHLKDLQDKKDLLEFELEEMSQLSYGGSEDEFSPRKQADKDNVKLPLSLEDVKAQLEELETEKSNVLSDIHLEALRQARTSLTAMPQKISHLEATEAILRSKVKDLEERRNTIHRPYYIDDTQQVSHLAEMESLNKTDDQSDTMNQDITEFTDVDFDDHMNVKQFENKDSVTELTSVELCDMERIYEKFLRDSHVDFCNQSTNTDSSSVTKVDSEVMTDFVWVDIVEVEETYKEFLENMASFEGLSLVKPTLNKIEKETATDFSYYDIVKLETMGRQLEELHEAALKRGEQRKEQGCNTEVVEKHETECNTDHVQKYDMFSLTDLTMSEIDQKRDMLAVSMSRVQDLENELLINKNEAMVKNSKLEQQEREYKEKIKNLNELLAEEKEMRKTDQAKVQDRELLYQGLVDRFTVEVQHTMAQEIVVTAIGNALTALANETLDKTFRNNTMQEMNHLKALIQEKDETLEQLQKQLIESIKLDEVKALRDALAEKEQSLTELRDMLIGAEVEKDKIVQNLGEDINALQKQLLREKELREKEIMQQQCLNEHRESYEQKIIECQAINQELQEQVKDLQEQHLNEESKLSEYREKIEKNELLYYQRCQEKIAQDTVTKAIINALSEVVNTRMMALKRQITSEEEVREFYEEMIEQYEKLHQESLNEKDSSQYQRAAHTIVLKAVNDAVSVVANVAITDLHEQLERQHGNEEELKETQERVDLLRQEIAVQRLVMKAVVNALSHVANEAIHSVLYDLQQQANSKQTSLSRHNETLTDLTDEYIENLQDPYQSNLLELELLRSTMSEQERELGKVNDEISVLRHDKKDLDDKCVLLSQQDQLNREQINDLQQKLKMEQNRQETSEKNNRAVQQDLVEEMQLNIAHMIVKNVVSNAIATEQMNNLQEQLKMKQEIQETMEEKLIENEEVYQQFVKTLTEQEKEKIAKSIVSESITSALVQVSNEIIHDLQHHLLMEQETKEAVAKKNVEITVDKDEAEVMTDLRWEDINHMENNYQELIESAQLLTTQFTQKEQCDAGIMTDMSWTDVLNVEEKYQEFRENIQEIQDKLAMVDVDKDDVEVMTDCTWDEMMEHEQLYEQQIEDLQQQLTTQNQRVEDEKTNADKYQMIIQEHLSRTCEDKCSMTDMVWTQDLLERTAKDIGQRSTYQAISEVANEVVYDLQQQANSKQTSLSRDKETLTDLTDEYIENLQDSYQSNFLELELLRSTMSEQERELDKVNDEISVLRHDKKDLDDKCVLLSQQDQLNREQINDLQQKLKMEQNRQETSEKNNRAVQQDLVGEMQLNIAHIIVKNVVSNAIATEQMNNLQEQLKMKQEIQETMEEKFIENEEAYQQFVKTLTEQEKEKIAKSIVSESITSALVQVSNEIIHDLQHHLLMEQETKEAVAKKYVEITVDKDEAEVMTDLRWEDINHMENNYQQLIEDLQQQLTTQNQRVEDEKTNADKYQMIIQEHLSRTCEDKCSMTDMEWTQDLLERTAKDIGQRSQLDAIFELANEGTNESVKIDKVTMTEVSWKEIEWVEELRLMKEDIQRKAAECKDQICMTDGPCLQDALVMTDLDLEQIAALEMVKDKSVLLHKDTMTDLKWDDVMYLETTYLQKLDELQIIAASIKDSEHKETIGRESMTELSWTDVLSLETSYKEELEKISLLEESLHHVNNDLMDEGTMTTLNWYEVECQLGTYRDQIDALKQMLEDEKARSSVEQIQVTEAGIVERSCMDELGWAFSLDAIEDDVEVDDDILVNSFQQSKEEAASMTDIGWQDLVCKDSFDNSMNDKCCSTDITLQCSAHINITAMEEKVEKESTTDLSVIDLINMEDIYWQEMQRLEELSEKHCKLADKNCMTDQVLTDNTECMTELSSYDIDQMNKEEQHTTIDDKDLKSKKENTLTDKLEPKHESDANIGFEFDESLEDSLTRDRDHRTQETSTDITLDDMVYFEDLEVKHHELMMKTKQGSMSPLDKNGKPISTNKQTDTNVTLDDMNYSELSIDQLENKHIPTSPSGDLHEGTPHNLTIDTVRCDQETSTELTLDQLDHLENLQLQNQELDKEQWKGVSASHVSNVLLIDQETETDFTDTDFDHFESLIHELKLENELYKQQFADKEPDKDLQDKQVETELDDVESLIHELKLENELYKQQLADKDKDLQDKQVETELTLEDIDMYEDSELSWIDYKAQSEQEIESLNKEYNEVKKRKASLESHFQELEQIHQKCVDRQTRSSEQAVDTELTLEHLSHLEEFKSLHQQCSERKVCTDIGVATDLTLTEIHYLEEIDTVHTEYCMTSMDNDASSRTESSATESKAVGTELTASVLAYLEEVSSTHEDIVREYEAFRQSVNKEKNEADTMTEMTIEHLDYLDEMALKSEELENMLIDVTEEAKLKQYEFENKKKVFSKELMTDLSLSDINILENELSGLRQRQKESRKSVKLSRSGYECLLDIDNTKKRHDIALMTELTIDNLKSLENSDNLYMDLKERGDLSRLEDLNKPMDEHSTITDLRGTNIDHLEHIETLYDENERRKGNMRDKQTETSQNIVDPPEETLTTVETAEAVFGSCPREKRSRAGRYANVDHLNDDGNHGSKSVEVGVQCELKDLLSLIREQHEKDGKDDSQWYVSALKIKREYKDGFDPVEVVLRSGRKSSTPDVSSRDYSNKRDSFVDHKGNTTSASLDYGWQSTMSLDASGLERTPTKGTAIGRWDSPQVPLAQDEVFDISDIDSTASEESLIAPLRKDSAVSKFDRYVMARKESEIELLSNLRDTTDQADGPNRTRRNMTEVLKENEALKMRILELELLVSQKGDLSDEELQLLKQKIKQLQAAEQQMEELHESNSALKDRLNQLHDDNLESGASTSRTVRDNWSEIDPSEGRTRLLLVQDWGLDDTDLESLFSARDGAVSPAESLETSALRRLLDEYVKADNATQAGPGPGVNQEIQTTGDLLKLIDLSYDGTIPDHIAKELEKLKIENKELYQELLQLRKLKLKNSQASDSGIIPRDTIEEPVTSSVQTPSESHNDWMTVLGVTDDGQSNRPKYQQPVKDLDDVLNDNPRPKGRQYPTNTIDEPEIKTSRSSRDVTADIDRGINHLSEMDDARPRTDTDAILDFDLEHFGPPDIAPPPVPSEPPPDNDPYGLDNSSNSVFDSSPPRDSKALRAATRTRNQPGRPVISETTIQPHVEMNVERQPTSPGLADIPPALRISQTPVQNRPGITMQPFTPKPVPPPTLPKPKATHPGGVRRPGTMSREADDDVGITPRGYVRATASAINQGEIDALGEKINFLEKQLKNKDGVIRSMKNEATEIENKALVERKEREIKLLEDDVAFLKQENQKKERDLLVKTGEINRKSYEVDQWKAEATNAEKQRKRIETSYMNLQSQTRNLHGANNKLSELQSKFNSLEKENTQLLDQVNKLEKAEKEFKQLEYNITVLQNHLRDMESVEKERDELSNKLKTVENQRDDLLKKGRMVESERNDFLRNNKIMEMQRDELEQRYAIAHEDLMNLKATAGDLQQSIKEAENTSLDTKHECNYLQTQYKKLEAEKLELEHQLLAVTRERNGLDARLAELEDRSREYLKLEDGFHTLRLKVAELTRQRDEFETQIPTLKAKVTLLKKACKEKDEFIDKLNEEIRELRHSIATSTLDDLSKIKSYGYSPDSFVKYSGKQGKESKSPSTKTSPRKAFPKRCVALFDYNPRTASVSGQPDKELTLKEGDHVTLLADMDIHGCYEAELNGVKGLVPGLYVEDVDECLDSTSKDPMIKKRTPVANNNVEPDVINSMNHGSTSPRSKASDIDIQRQCFVALFDYDPYQSCTSGRPELELPFRKGDIMTVYGDMDSNRYYRAEMEGQTGLVPSNFVEEVSSSTFLQPQSYSSTAPRQILSMFDNIKVSSPQRPGSSFPLPTPPYTSPRQVTNSHPPSLGIVPSSHMTAPVFSAHPGGVMTSNHVIHPVPSTNGITPSVATTSPRREQTIQPIFTPHMSPAEVQKLAAPIATSKPRASQRSPRQQSLTSKRSSSQPVTSPPRITSQNNQLVNKPKPSKALASRPTGSRGLPSPPTNLHVLRPVNHDAILLGWTLPELDEFGRSNGTVVKGYKIYENSDYKMDVRSQFMAKALVDNLDLRYPIQFTVRTIGEGGTLSTEASTTFTDTINNSRMSISKAIEGTVGSGDQHRTFVALYDYDPLKNSPNANPQYELHFSEGDILRVEDISRKDGFYFGSLNGKKGLIPSNFIEEVAVRTPSSPIRKDHDASIGSSQRHRKKMVALYDYNPKEQSPLKNTESELSFRKGQTITVLGPMNKDGFYNAAIDGRQGLVPASFLETSLELSQSNQRPPRSA